VAMSSVQKEPRWGMRSGILFVAIVLALVLGGCTAARPVGHAPATVDQATSRPPLTPAIGTAPVTGDQATSRPPFMPALGTAPEIQIIWLVRSEQIEQTWENEIIAGFEASHPGVKIDLVVAPWPDFDSTLQAMTDAGAPPDIWSHWGPSGFQDYVKRGLVADLTPLIEVDRFDLSDFMPDVLKIYTVDGKVMGLPILTTGSFIFYNKDAFDAARVKYPPTNWDDKTWTWDALLEKAKALTKDTDDPQRAMFGYFGDAWPNDAYCWLFGQDLYPDSAYQTGFASESYLDKPGCVKGFQANQDIVWKLHYAPDPAQSNAISGGGDLFQTGKVGMCFTGGWGWWNYSAAHLEKKFRWGVAALPWGGDNRRDVVFTDPWMLSSKTGHPQEAWAFLKYLVSADVQEQWMNLTGAPPVRLSLAEKWYQQFPSMKPEEVKEVALGAIKYGRESPNHLLVKFDQLDQVVKSAVDPINNNEKKAADVMGDVNIKLTAALKQIEADYK